MDLYLVRHTSVAKKGMCYGHHDVPLADTFAEEIQQLRRKLPTDLSQGVFFSSPSQRCKLLAQHLAGEKVRIDARLMELNFGDWENRSWDSITKEEMQPWSEDFVHLSPPRGESFKDLARRCDEFWQEMQASGHQQVLVVTHGGWMRALLAQILDLPLQHAFRMHIDYGGVAHIRKQHGIFQVLCINR